MKIIVTGLIAFIIWSLFSTWLFVTRIKPAMEEPVTLQTAPEPAVEVPATPVSPVEQAPKDLTILFEFDRTSCTPDQQTETGVAEFKTWIDKHPEAVIQVTGHTDFVGTQQYNNELGLKRAQSVKNYLVSKGIPEGRITIDSRGEDQPAADNITSAGRSKNRRAEISIKK